MPLAIMALAGQGAAIGQLQITLRSLKGLDRGFLVHAQHNSLRGWGDIEANNIGGFGRKVRVVALTPGLASREVNLMATQERHTYWTSTSPSAWASRGPVQRANPCGAGLSSSCRIRLSVAFDRSAACPAAACLAAPQGHGRHGDAAKADNPRLNPDFLGDRPGAAPVRRQQNYPSPLQIALQRHRRATTRLQHLAIFPRKVDFSCFRNHPYLESRLTIQGKWVLDVRFLGSNHIRRRRRACRTKCGRRDGD